MSAIADKRRATPLGKYELLVTIGRAGGAEVHLGRQRGATGFEKLARVRVVDRSATALLDEARRAALIRHPGVIDIYDVGDADGKHYIATEDLDGVSLRGIIERGRTGKRFDELDVARVIAHAAEALDAVHDLRSATGDAAGFAHGHLTQDSVVVLTTGQVKLADFGSTADPNTTLPPELVGDRRPDRRSDYYALAVVMWEALTHDHFLRSTVDTPIRHASEVNANVPAAFDGILGRALSRDPAERYATGTELANDIEDVLGQAGYPRRNDRIATYLRETFKDRIAARQQVMQDLVAGKAPGAQTVEAAFGAGEPAAKPERGPKTLPMPRKQKPATIPPVAAAPTPAPLAAPKPATIPPVAAAPTPAPAPAPKPATIPPVAAAPTPARAPAPKPATIPPVAVAPPAPVTPKPPTIPPSTPVIAKLPSNPPRLDTDDLSVGDETKQVSPPPPVSASRPPEPMRLSSTPPGATAAATSPAAKLTIPTRATTAPAAAPPPPTPKAAAATAADPADVVSLPGAGSGTGEHDVLSKWAWQTDSHPVIDDADDDYHAPPKNKRTLVYLIGAGLVAASIVALIAFAFGGKRKDKDREPPPAASAEEAAANAAAAEPPPSEPTPADPPDEIVVPELGPVAMASGSSGSGSGSGSAGSGSAESGSAGSGSAGSAALAGSAAPMTPPTAPPTEPAAPPTEAVAAPPSTEPTVAPPTPEPVVEPVAPPPEPVVEPKPKPQPRAEKAKPKPEPRARTKAEPKPKPDKPKPPSGPIDPYAEDTAAKPKPSAGDADKAYRTGIQLFARGDSAGALASLKDANQSDARTQRALGLVYEKMGKAAQARAAFKRYLKLSPRAGDADQIRSRMEKL